MECLIYHVGELGFYQVTNERMMQVEEKHFHRALWELREELIAKVKLLGETVLGPKQRILHTRMHSCLFGILIICERNLLKF